MWLRLSRCLSNAPQARANAAAIRFHANRADFDPIVTSARIATQKLRIIVYRVDDHIDVAVVVKISDSAAPAGDPVGDAGAALFRDVREAAVSLVTIEQLALPVSGVGFELLDVW